MHAILKDTAEHYEAATKAWREEMENELNEGVGEDADKDKEDQKHLKLTRAAEVRVVRNAKTLREPPDLEQFKAKPVDVEVEDDVGVEKDELGVKKLAAGMGDVTQ